METIDVASLFIKNKNKKTIKCPLLLKFGQSQFEMSIVIIHFENIIKIFILFIPEVFYFFE